MARFTGGWIKLWRRAWDGDLGDNIFLWALWNWLLHAATYKPSSIVWEGKRRDLPAGTVVFGISELAVKWECSKSTITKWLRYLESSERIAIETCPRGTLVSILNWDVYQGQHNEERTPSEHNANTERTQRERSANLSEESKKERSKEYTSGFDFEEVWNLYPRKTNKSEARARFARLVKSQDDYEKLKLAIKHYTDDCVRAKREPEHIRHMTTFLGTEKVPSWRDWINPPPSTVSAVQPALTGWDTVKPQKWFDPTEEVASG
jgi:hypothetical protein